MHYIQHLNVAFGPDEAAECLATIEFLMSNHIDFDLQHDPLPSGPPEGLQRVLDALRRVDAAEAADRGLLSDHVDIDDANVRDMEKQGRLFESEAQQRAAHNATIQERKRHEFVVALAVACATCGAPPGHRCVTLDGTREYSGNRHHKARYEYVGFSR